MSAGAKVVIETANNTYTYWNEDEWSEHFSELETRVDEAKDHEFLSFVGNDDTRGLLVRRDKIEEIDVRESS